jgi:hypothetical protein
MNDRFKRVNPRTGRPIDQFVTSPKLFEIDPLEAEVGLVPAYVTFLTVAILKPWTDSKGATHTYQRRLVALKGDAMDMMATIREQQLRAGHTDAPLRGVHVVFKRGTDNRSLRSGLPVFIERHSEAEIMETFAHPAKYGEQDNKLIKAENEDCYPIDYARAFPKPSAEAIRARYNLGGSSVAGSSGYTRGHFDDGATGAADTSGFNDGGQGGDTWSGNGAGNGAGRSGSLAEDLEDDIPF